MKKISEKMSTYPDILITKLLPAGPLSNAFNFCISAAVSSKSKSYNDQKKFLVITEPSQSQSCVRK